jgi:hypothetical protein
MPFTFYLFRLDENTDFIWSLPLGVEFYISEEVLRADDDDIVDAPSHSRHAERRWRSEWFITRGQYPAVPMTHAHARQSPRRPAMEFYQNARFQADAIAVDGT